VLQNLVPVEALYDPEAAHEAALRNLLQRRGFASLEAVREEGREEDREAGEVALVLRLIERRLGAIPEADRAAVRSLGSDRLTALAEALGGLATPADLALWLRGAAG
jgi:hypothetical protein